MSRDRVGVDPHHYDALEIEMKDRGFRTVSGMLWFILAERYRDGQLEFKNADSPTKANI